MKSDQFKNKQRAKAHKHMARRHTCFCGRTLHGDEAWNQHKGYCKSWAQQPRPDPGQ